MTTEEVINQLECLRSHAEDYADKEEPNSIWHRDIAALSIAIKIIKRSLRSTNPSRPQ